MGYLGLFAGALIIFPIQPLPVVQAFWLLAFAAMLAGRSPTAIPPAWASGRAEPWPSSTEARGGRQRQSPGGRWSRGASATKPTPKVPTEPASDAQARTRATTPKRKRKKRK
jgi:hypothetical protein